MASAMYSAAKEDFLGAAINMSSDTIQVRLVSTGYTFSAAHTSMSDTTSYKLNTDQTLGSKTITNGVFDAANVTWSSVASGSTIGGAVIFKFNTDDAGSTPIAYIDLTDTATNGGDASITWDNGANKIFALNG